MYFSLFQLPLFLRSAHANPNVRQIQGVARADVTATLVVVTSILCTVTTEAIVYQVWRTLFMFIYHLLCNLLHFVFLVQPRNVKVLSIGFIVCINPDVEICKKCIKLKFKCVFLRVFENIPFCFKSRDLGTIYLQMKINWLYLHL